MSVWSCRPFHRLMQSLLHHLVAARHHSLRDRQAAGGTEQVFQPESGCRYHQYGRPEILEYFQGSKTDILIVGDSFMRQLFVRLLHLMRGQVRAALCRRAPPLLHMRFRSRQTMGAGLGRARC